MLDFTPTPPQQISAVLGHFLDTFLGPVFVSPNRRPEPLFFRFWIPILDPFFLIYLWLTSALRFLKDV